MAWKPYCRRWNQKSLWSRPHTSSFPPRDGRTTVLSFIFQQSLDSGTVPDDWRTANVVPILKQEASRPESSAVNNTLSMIHTQWNQRTLIWPFNAKVKCHEVNWKTIYDLLYNAQFDMILHLEDTTFWKSCDLDLTLKGYPRSNVFR